MCTSFDILINTAELVSKFGKIGKGLNVTAKVGEITPGKSRMRPTDLVPVIRLIDGEYSLDAMRWGFKLQTGPMVNSRIEEISGGAKADYWQSLLKENPCLFVMHGYHEWKKVVIDTFTPKTGKPTKKIERHPYRFTLKEEDTFFCAGYFRKEKDNGEYSCTLITTVGNEITNVVHDKGRMPVIVTLEAGLQYLEATLEERIAMCQTYPPDKMNSDPTELK